MIKKIIKNLLSFFKLKLVKISNNQNFPIEAKIEIKKFINLSSKFSMTGEKIIQSKAINLYNRVNFCWAKYGLYELDGLVQTIDIHRNNNNYYGIIGLSETFFKHPTVMYNIRDKNCYLN